MGAVTASAPRVVWNAAMVKTNTISSVAAAHVVFAVRVDIVLALLIKCLVSNR